MGTFQARQRSRPTRRHPTFERLEGRQLFAAAPPAGSVKLTGAVLGTAGSYQNKGNTAANVFDGNTGTIFDAPSGVGTAWAGLDLGAAARVTRVQFVPRNGFAARMVGGQFQAANAADFSDGVILSTVTAPPALGRFTTAAVTDAGAYRFVRYVAPAGAYGNVAEVEFDGVVPIPPPTTAPDAPRAMSATASPGSVQLSWAAGSTVKVDAYTVQRLGPTDADYVTLATTVTPAYADAAVVAGVTYSYRVVAANAVGASNPSASVTVAVPTTVVNAWSDADLGSPAKAGSSTADANGTVTVTGGGADIWNTADQFHFASQPMVGNGTVVAQVVSQSNTNGWAKGGIMVRESANADSRFVLLALTPNNGVAFQVRTATHAAPSVNKTVAGKAGVWLRIARDGSTFTGSASADGGATWTVVGSATVPMVDNVLAGLAVSAHDNARASSVRFANPSVATTGTTASAWTAAAATPMNRWESQTFTYAGRLYVFGGFVDRNMDATAEGDVYDPATDTWSFVTTVPAVGGLTHAAVTVVGDMAYFAGGTIGAFANHSGATTSAAVLTYNLTTNTWGLVAPLPYAGSCGGLVCVNHALYYYGGLNAANTADLNGTWALDLSDPAATWTAKVAMPNGRNHIGAVAINGVAYAIGGWHVYSTRTGNVADVHTYDPATDTWRAVASLPAGLGSIETSTIVVNGKVVVVGGNTNGGFGGAYQNTVQVYDPVANRWSVAVTLPEVNEGMSVAYVDGRLIVAGGTVDNQGGWATNQTWVTTITI